MPSFLFSTIPVFPVKFQLGGFGFYPLLLKNGGIRNKIGVQKGRTSITQDIDKAIKLINY